MKIAVVGCGAVGSYYGAQLCRAGHDVRFLLRSDYEAVLTRGVFIRSPTGCFRVCPGCARSPEEIGGCDLVLIGLKTTANHQYPILLPPLVRSSTAILTLQNGLGNEETLAELFPSTRILGGLCFVCLNRVEPGVIHHLDHGLIVLGEHRADPGTRPDQVASLLRSAGVNCRVTENLARAHWEKLVWNIPFNGLGVASVAGHRVFGSHSSATECRATGPCLTTDRLLGDPQWELLVHELMMEVIRIANALGFAVAESLVQKQIELTRTMGAYKASTLIDFEKKRPIELEGLFREPLRQARKAGVSVPRLERLCEVLERLDSGRPGDESLKQSDS